MTNFSYFPEVAGTEEETRISIVSPAQGDQPLTTWALADEAHHKLNRGIDKFCPSLPGSKEFRENGSRTYVDAGGVELATPEVDNPEDQWIYVNAQARLLEKSLERYMCGESRARRQRLTGLFHRRVIDDENNTWGCHDNFSVQNPGYEGLVLEPEFDAGHVWVGYLYSRTFITGAMRIGEDAATFSQKLSVPHVFNRYGYINSLLRTNADHGQRLEIRCNDINLQRWAFLSRIGCAALVLTATQTPLAVKLSKSSQFKFEEPDPEWNVIPLDENLEIFASKSLLRAIEMQHYVISTILEELENYTGEPMPSIYRTIGQSTLRYCEDMEAIVYGRKGLEALDNRADWAAKLNVIIEHIRRNPSERRLGDEKSRRADLLYDRVAIHAHPNGSVETLHGYGYKLAAEAAQPHDNNSIEKAMRRPPQNTRAAVRVHAAKRLHGFVRKCDWHALRVTDEQGQEKSVSLEKLRKAIPK
jgi:hypothetical protein